ncbi:Uncharacterised protein [Vibrio cholerae]|nr:Uncharacterised protein [Vibrio cholerae]
MRVPQQYLPLRGQIESQWANERVVQVILYVYFYRYYLWRSASLRVHKDF